MVRDFKPGIFFLVSFGPDPVHFHSQFILNSIQPLLIIDDSDYEDDVVIEEGPVECYHQKITKKFEAFEGSITGRRFYECSDEVSCHACPALLISNLMLTTLFL